MTDKLKKKLERQAKQTENALTNYSVSVKKAKGTKYSTNGLWK